ncbi:uncharacterized protein isoform X2 [Rhodnius prolixus]|uniref:uncharacterized protein isoform X2 n=1 Tax=Rhodnius prolixus TaxID=13249 RepID=UPI003D18E2CF
MSRRIDLRVSFKYQKKKKKLRFNGKDFFRVSVRNALHHYEWLKDDLLPPEELEEKDRSSGHLLNFQEKVLLMQSPRNRPEAELQKVAEKFQTCKFFRGFSLPKLTNIFKVARLVFVGPNRTILKKGHQPQNMYFVIGGMAVSRRDEKSEQIHQEEIENTVYIIPGCKFADINLFFGEPINYSVWTGDQCTQGKPLVMFIIDGIVQVIERLLVYERPLKHQHDKQIYQLYHFQETLQTLPPNVKPVFMNTVTLTSGACVGFGEELFKHIMYAVTDIKTLRVPVSVLQQHSFSYKWKQNVLTLNQVCPNRRQLFEAFVDGRKWGQYKKKIMPSTNKSNVFQTSIHDVPILMRAEHLRLKPALMEAIDRDPDFQMYKEGKEERDAIHITCVCWYECCHLDSSVHRTWE